MPDTARGSDYVIAGAGAVGSALAARLTENPAVSVAVLEAGGNNRPSDFRRHSGVVRPASR